MEKFNKFLDFIMTDKTASIIFYVILGSLALLFLVLIITTITSAGKKNKEKNTQNLVSEDNSKKEEVKEEIKEDSKPVTEEIKETAIKEEKSVPEEKEPLTETMTFNDMLMKPESNEETEQEEVGSSVYLDKSADIKSDYNENLMESIIKKVDMPSDSAEDVKDDKVSLEEKGKDNHDTTNNVNAESKQVNTSDIDQLLNDSSSRGKSIGELLSFKETEKPTLESAVISDIETGNLDKQENLEDATLKEEAIKPKFIEEEISKLPTESNEKKDFVSNDELRSRLEKLKGLHNQNAASGKETSNETEKIDSELESIMKSVGLEDTMVIPNIKSEEKILGK